MAGSSRLGSWVRVTIAVLLSILISWKQSSGQELIITSSGNLSVEANASLGSIIVTSKSSNFAILLYHWSHLKQSIRNCKERNRNFNSREQSTQRNYYRKRNRYKWDCKSQKRLEQWEL